jgi:flagellar hook assembly protein FlgD
MRHFIKFWVVLGAVLILCQYPVFSGGKPEPPKILERSGPQYFSPNGDGVKDQATIDFKVELWVNSDKGYIPEAVLQIRDSDRGVVKQFKKTEKTDRGFFARIFGGNKKFVKEGYFTWDGRKEDGTVALEGDYDFTLIVKDASNQPVEVTLETAFILDNTPPKITKLVVDTPFSPNGDGNKDTLRVMQEGTEEALWTGTIENLSGVVLKEFRWENSRPKDFEWDGTEEDGSQYTYEIYRYRLTGTDSAGNTYSRLAEEQIVLDRTETPIAIALDYSHFSPNGDGIQDTVTISLTTEIKVGVTSWSVTVADVNGPVKRRYEGGAEVPTRLIFDGNDDRGVLLPDGEYWVTYGVKYVKGDDRKAQTIVTLDTTKPDIGISVTHPYFSPNGDGSQDTTDVDIRSNEPVTAQGRILGPDGNVLLEATATDTAALITFDGLDPTGAHVPEGTYTLQASFTDRAGNSTSREEKIVVDVTPPEITVKADPTEYSPDGDGFKDTVTVTMRSSEPVTGSAEVIDPGGRPIISVNVPETSSEEVVLDELRGPTMPLVNGTYKVTGRFRDAAGNWVEPEPLLITRDDRMTRVELALSESSFSPNGDGNLDTIRLAVEATLRDNIKEWSVTVEDKVGRSVKSVSGSGAVPGSIEWDGTVDGEVAPEGMYSARVQVEWTKGDIREAVSEPFLLDVSPPTVSVTTTSSPFVKRDGEIEGRAFITIQVDDVSGVEDWKLDILDRSREIVRSYEGEGNPSDKITWEGESEEKREYEESEELILRVEVTDRLGNRRTFEQPLDIDVIVYRKGDKLYLIVPNIIFGAYKHALDSRGKEWEDKNWASIKRVMNVMRKYSNYGIELEGHALNIYRGNPVAENKEEEILGPLTVRRAATVKDALMKLGLDETRIQTAAYGGHFPIVSTKDREVWWKNRRVEFRLLTPE